MKINEMIDHTLLKPFATTKQIETLVEEAIEHDFKSVCVNPTHVKKCAKLLNGKNPLVCTVIGFPLGANTSTVKAFEAKEAIENGANEIDMVLNIGALIEGNYDLVQSDIKAVKDACGDTLLKVIFETCLLSDKQIKTACELSIATGAEYVKTSTGFSTGGSTPEVVKLMNDTVDGKAFVKASGGVRSFADAEKVIEAGANRIGASAGIAIISGEVAKSDY